MAKINDLITLKTMTDQDGTSNIYALNSGTDTLATIAAAGYLNDVYNVLNPGDKILIRTSSDSVSYAATVRKDASNIYLDFDRTYRIPLRLADVSTQSTAYAPVPAGVIVEVGGTLDTAITVASCNITFEIATVAVTGAALEFTTAMSAGTLVTATPTALNVLAAAGALAVLTDGGSTTTSVGNFYAKIICPASQ